MVAHLEILGNYIKKCTSPLLNHSSWPKSSNANMHRVFSVWAAVPFIRMVAVKFVPSMLLASLHMKNLASEEL